MAKQYIDVLIDGKVYSLGGSETEGYSCGKKHQ